MRLNTDVRWWLVAIGGAFIVAYAVALAWAFETQSYNVWGSLLWAPIIAGINVLLIWQVSRRESDPWIIGLMGLGYLLKMLGSFARYFTVFVIYGGVGDATRYNYYASYQHELWRKGLFVWIPEGKPGTQNLELVTTAVYTVIGPAPLAGFLVFASFAYWGSYLIYRAFRVAIPDGNHRVYAALIFLLPSMLFWPSSIGKEAWLLLWLGVLVLGAARFFTGTSRAWPFLLLGAVGTALIRPHLTVLLMASLLTAQAFRPARRSSLAILGKVAGVAVLGGAVFILTTQSAEFLGIDDLTISSVTDTVDWASEQTEQGGSAFTPVPLLHPLGVPAAIGTILFRPFPWEVMSFTAAIQSFEGMAFMVLVLLRWPSIRQTPRLMRRNPYVTFIVIYAVFFMVAFAGFGNFGILARQRTLMIPLFLVLLALPKGSRKNWAATTRPRYAYIDQRVHR